MKDALIEVKFREGDALLCKGCESVCKYIAFDRTGLITTSHGQPKSK